MARPTAFSDTSAVPASSPDEAAPACCSDKVAQRLLAHARLCRDIAAQSWNEDSARRLEDMADACLRAAGVTPPHSRFH